MKTSTIFTSRIKKGLIVLAWIVIWQIVDWIIGNDILFAGPIETLISLSGNIVTSQFWLTIITTLSKIALGYVIGTVLGLILAVMSYNIPLIEEIVAPPLALIKSAPVASFIVLFLIWWSSSVLDTAICACIVLPQIYVGVLTGLKSTDKSLLEMADVFGIHPLDRMNCIYMKSLKPHIESAVRISVPMAWKSGIAAEVIGTPDHTIGAGLYMSKIYIDTAGVLGWTFVVIVLSVVCEKLLLAVTSSFLARNHHIVGRTHNMGKELATESLIIQNVTKTFGSTSVYEKFNAEYRHNETVYLTSASGSGKTTLLRMIAGLDKADAGEILLGDNKSVAYLFQEDRLCEEYTAVDNVTLVCADEIKATELLAELIGEEHIHKKVCNLSGGQRRRVAIVRACAAGADIVLLDEPYSGLDEENIAVATDFIRRHTKGCIVVMATHIVGR